jgi:transaldolase
MTFSDLKVKLFADGADCAVIAALARLPYIAGFTTNPTLMRKAGVQNYRNFARQVLELVPDRPVSFEVFADHFDAMEEQAFEIASWGKNVFVKIPVTNTEGRSACPLIRRLARAGVQVNVTALLTARQVRRVADVLCSEVRSFVSVFAGRIADAGQDPLPIMEESLRVLAPLQKAQLIWASPRELLNVIQADRIGCHVLTATKDILDKLHLIGKDLECYSLETVRMFHRDAQEAGFAIELSRKRRAA